MDSHNKKAEDLTTVGGRLRLALKTAGKLQRDVADHFKVSEQAVSQWFRNVTEPDRDKIFELARLLAVRPEWILHGTLPREPDGTLLTNNSKQIGEEPLTDRVINIHQFPRDIPILGSGACGEDGLFELNGQVHGYARRTPRLMGVRGAYAVYIQGLSMFPWRKPGQLVYVDPYQPPKIEDFVVVQLKATGPDAHHPAYIKQLVRLNPKELRLHQFNPDEDLTIPFAKVHTVHRVIDWDELLGLGA